MSDKPKILERVRVEIDPELSWTGSFEDYLQKILEYPPTLRTAHQRLYDAVSRYGFGRYSRYREEVVRYRILDDPFDNEHRHAIYGENVDIALMRFFDTLKAAAFGLGQEYRAYLLHGPIGTAKSTLAELLAKALEDYTKRPEGQLFAPYWVVEEGDDEGMEILGTVTQKFERTIKHCPIHEEPLLVLPQEIRKGVVTELDQAIKSNAPVMRILGGNNPCPQCGDIFRRFMRRYSNNWRTVIEKHLRVRRLVLSKAERVGIVAVRPKSDKDQDVTEFLGEHDFSKLAVFGSTSDPRTFDFAGHYMKANRGMFYWEEQIKFALTFLYDLLGATQEHRVQPKSFMEIDVDEVILGSTNETDYLKLKEKDEMQALRDRIIKIDIPYILEVKNEEKVYAKFFGESRRGGKHLAPHTIFTCAFWAVLTRVDDPKTPNLDRRGKVQLYNGQIVPGFNEDTAKEILKEAERDGMQGISPRYIHDRLSAAFMAVDTKNCVNFFAAIKELKEGLRRHPHIKNNELRKKYEELLAIAQEALTEKLKGDLYTAIVGNETDVEELFKKYIDQITAYLNKEKVKNQITGEDVDPDEDFMREVERMIEVSDHDVFRQKIINAMTKRAVQRERDPSVAPFTYKTDARLEKALKLYLYEKEKDKINWESLISRKSIDQEGQRRIDTIRERLVGLGYCEICAAEVMAYIAGIFRRGAKR